MDQLGQSNRLQAHKSSYQAWKCASLGYALLAIVLIASKWHEVSTDLSLLMGIDQLIWAQQLSANQTANQTTSGPVESSTTTFTLNSLLALSSNVTATNRLELMGQAGERAPNASDFLVSQHMQMLLGRELNGNDLLRREVEAFLGEFRSAKSTLGLSSLLVSVYIVSWILMSLAVNDTQISNDISLRNILLLSVFGAIDMAASVAFVVVRIIMFKVKNSAFFDEILGSSGLRETPVRLSSDQLTAFTALRLIAMRSCSAYVDIYVSFIVALLTLLRLYAVIRAIAYYRFLKRYNDAQRALCYQQQQHRMHRSASFIANSNDEQPLVGYSSDSSVSAGASGKPSAGMWPPNMQVANRNHHQMMSPRVNFSQTGSPLGYRGVPNGVPLASTTIQLGPNGGLVDDDSEQLASVRASFTLDPAASQRQSATATFPSVESAQQVRSSRKPGKLLANDEHNNESLAQHDDEQVALFSSVPASGGGGGGGNRGRQQLNLELNQLLLEQQKLIRQQQQPSRYHTGSLQKSSAPNVLLVNGRPHRLVMDQGPEEPLGGSGFESEPSDPSRRWWSAVSEQQATVRNSEQPAASFTLLSAKQLDRLSRRLIASANKPSATLSLAKATKDENNNQQQATVGKYKLVARYRPIVGAPAVDQWQQQQQQQSIPRASARQKRQAETELRATTAASSCESAASSCELADDSDAPRTVSGRARQQAGGLRQSEELVQHRQARREMSLLDKCDNERKKVAPDNHQQLQQPAKWNTAQWSGARQSGTTTTSSAIGTNSEPTSDHFERTDFQANGC